MTETEAYERLSQWAIENGMNPAVGGDDWQATAIETLWVITPPGRGNTVYVIAPSEVRAVHPSHEDLGDVVERLAP